MNKRIIIFCIGICCFCSCNLLEKENKEYMSKFKINKTIDKEAITDLSKEICLPVAITKSGFCRITDTSDFDTYLKSNSTLTEFFQDTGKAIARLRFCYAYLSKDSVCIKFHEANFSDKTPLIKVLIYRDSFQIKHSFWSDGRPKINSETQYQDLVLNKKHYQVGDTLSGYLAFKGYQKTEIKVKENFKGYFQCIIGDSEKALDNVKYYKTCLQ
jgi:hypothetical protein